MGPRTLEMFSQFELPSPVFHNGKAFVQNQPGELTIGNSEFTFSEILLFKF